MQRADAEMFLRLNQSDLVMTLKVGRKGRGQGRGKRQGGGGGGELRLLGQHGVVQVEVRGVDERSTGDR